MKQVACFVGWTFLAVALLLTRCPLALSQASQERGFRLSSSASKEIENGSYYALVIGINQYHQPLPILNTAVSDAQALTRILSERYGFQVQLLLDGNATRSKILNALSQYRRSLHENDNLLIYYAGHGHADSDSGKAYWLPADAESDTPSNWIIADELTTDIRVLPARHVLIISDSCYSGGLTRDTKLSVKPDDQQMFLRKMLASKSRTLMASGGNEPVADSGAGGHSVFANALLRALERVDTDAFTAGDLFHDFVLRQVAGRSDQIPRYSFIRDSDDDDGDFVFVRQGSSAKNGISSEKIVATPRSLGASISEFLGEWKSGALNSVFTVNRKECTAVPFIERTLHLEGVPGTHNRMRGKWSRETTYTWISSNGSQCRWDKEDSFSSSLSAVMLYTIDGTLDLKTGILDIRGTYDKCTGEGCAIWLNADSRNSFQTKLLKTAGAIVDTDPTMNSLIKFIRTSDAVGREEEARLAADQELAIVDKGYFDRFLKEVWSADSVTSDSRESIKPGMAAARDLRGEVISRIPVRAVYAEYSPQYSATAGDYVLLIRDVRTSKNSAGREIVMLGMQNGSWKVVWFEYVS